MSLKLLNYSLYKAIKQSTVSEEEGLNGVRHSRALGGTGRSLSSAPHWMPSIPGMNEAEDLLHAKLHRSISFVSSLTELKCPDKHNAIIS